MIRQVTAVIAGVLLLLCGSACASERYSSTHFSIEIPAGMITDDQKEDSISLVFAGDDELEKGTLAVSARKGEVTSLENQWQKVKPLMTNDKTVLFEKEVATPALTWKVIGINGRMGELETQSVTYYGVSDGVIYMLHYHCQEGRCNEIDDAFHKVLASFSPATNSPTRH